MGRLTGGWSEVADTAAQRVGGSFCRVDAGVEIGRRMIIVSSRCTLKS